MTEINEFLTIPEFNPGGVIKETQNYRIVMDWKPGLEGQVTGQRFFIEPKTDDGERMLKLAAEKHHIGNFNNRDVESKLRHSMRADFIVENLPSLIFGIIDIPDEGEDSIPSPDRMEERIKNHPQYYSFSD